MTAQTHDKPHGRRNIRGFAPLALATALMVGAPGAAALAQSYDSQYDAQQRDYQYRQSQYEEQRRAYDARYGNGASTRYYGDDRARYEDQAREACHDKKQGNTVAGGLLGGVAGAVIGSNVARGGGRTGGAVIGGVGGAALGAGIANNATHC